MYNKNYEQFHECISNKFKLKNKLLILRRFRGKSNIIISIGFIFQKNEII